jgi:hypothetical protein
MTRLAAVFLVSVALAGCSSSRFDGFSTASVPPTGSDRMDGSFGRGPQPDMPTPQSRPGSADQDVIPGGETGPAGAVTSEDIPPPPTSGGRSDLGPPAIDPALRPSEPNAQPRIMQEEPPRTGGTAPPALVSALPRQETTRSSTPTATTIAGTWTVTDAGDRCRITLTSSPLFEFYRASPQNCRAPSLARINAWEQRGNEVVLLQPGGRVAARLFPEGGGYSGQTSSGASVTMQR